MLFRFPVVVLACVMAFAAVPAHADKCTGAKLKAIGKKESGLLRCQSKVAATGDSSHLSACEIKAMTKFTAAFAKAGACAGDQQSGLSSHIITCRDLVSYAARCKIRMRSYASLMSMYCLFTTY